MFKAYRSSPSPHHKLLVPGRLKSELLAWKPRTPTQPHCPHLLPCGHASPPAGPRAPPVPSHPEPSCSFFPRKLHTFDPLSLRPWLQGCCPQRPTLATELRVTGSPLCYDYSQRMCVFIHPPPPEHKPQRGRNLGSPFLPGLHSTQNNA